MVLGLITHLVPTTNMSDYRFDQRSDKQFKQDIKLSHSKEAKIAVRLCIALHSLTKKWPTLKPAGVDMTGEFIEKAHQVTSEPDFLINDRLVEITRSDVLCNRSFHQKSNKIIRCLKDNGDLVFVNGFEATNQPKYIWLSAKELEPFVTRSLTKYGEVQHPGNRGIRSTGKPAYRFDVYWFEELWKPLPALIKDIPKDYKDVLNLAKV